MELEALIKHLRGELMNREKVILENIENMKVGYLYRELYLILESTYALNLFRKPTT